MENFCADLSEIYGSCDLLLLDASYCTWPGAYLMGHLDLEEYQYLTCFSSVLEIFKQFCHLTDFENLNIYEILSCISKIEIISK